MRIEPSMILRRMEEELNNDYQVSLREASAVQLHKALADAVMYGIAERWLDSRRQHETVRRAYYFSAEYLMGRMVFNNLYALGILHEVQRLLKAKGADLNTLEEIEDAALGNGGLGRLAACFLDSAATHELPLDGYGLRYRFGLFKQVFSDGFQEEKADNWLKYGDPWSRRRDDRTVEVEFADGKVLAVPYDMPVIGYETDQIGTLRLWQSEPIEEFDFSLFNDQEYDLAVREKNKVEDITRVLYPNDSTDEGKKLRIKQQYFLASASLQDILRRYKRFGGNITRFSDHYVIQLNDTHPVVAIPELIRLLMKEGMEFERALAVAKSTFCYTNHTVMQEALESWDYNLFAGVLPEIAALISRINDAMNRELAALGISQEKVERMQIASHGRIFMARLAVYAASHVNGVAEIHTEILKRELFRDWYEIDPEKFSNKTNGITPRRWLGLCNPELTKLVEQKIGGGFITDLSRISRLKEKIDDSAAERFNEIKLEKKRQLAEVIRKQEGVALPPEFLFDVQVKRLHEYKRQLLNGLCMMDIYFELKEGKLPEFMPTVFLFGAKAAPGYRRAKGIIKFINEAAKRIESDPEMSGRMRAVFVQNYNCSYAEHIIPAADVSEQISPAGTEASGTGNMKFMLNGAVTLGTYDGANIEIVRAAGAENNYIFGATVEDLAKIRECYDPRALYETEPRIRRALDTLVDGTLCDGGSGMFRELYDSLLTGSDWQRADPYYLLLDFMPYVETKLRANRDYRDRIAFGRKCLMNVAGAAGFSSDRTVFEYAEELWNIGRLRRY